MYSFEQHLDSLTRHLDRVRDNCNLLAKRLMAKDEKTLAVFLVKQGHIHDASKFEGIEWEYLHVGNAVPEDKLFEAVRHHAKNNPHHPEYWDGIAKMPRQFVAEMVCDWLARAQEFGTDLREWIKRDAIEKYDIPICSEQWKWIEEFTDLLLEDSFVKI